MINFIISQFIMKRRKQRNQTATKAEKLNCSICSTVLFSLLHFKQHIQNNANYKLLHPFSCQTCQYVGHNKYALCQHLESNESCKNFHEQKEIVTGLLTYKSSAYIAQKEEYYNIIILCHTHSSGILLMALWIICN